MTKLPGYLWLVAIWGVIGAPAIAGVAAPELDSNTLGALASGITGLYFGYGVYQATKAGK